MSMSDQGEIHALAYAEGIRALGIQAATLDQVRIRATGVLTTATIASVFLVGVVADAAGPDRDPVYWALAIIGGMLYSALLCLVVALQLPRFEWRFLLLPQPIVEAYADAVPSKTLSETHRDLCLHVDCNIHHNQRNLSSMHRLLAGALVLLVLEITTWAVLAAKTA